MVGDCTDENIIKTGSAKIPVRRLVMSLKYAVEQRMRFIDFLLCRYEEVGRAELVDFFGISKPQATNDFRTYLNIAPDNARYVTARKKYVRNPEFQRVWR